MPHDVPAEPQAAPRPGKRKTSRIAGVEVYVTTMLPQIRWLVIGNIAASLCGTAAIFALILFGRG